MARLGPKAPAEGGTMGRIIGPLPILTTQRPQRSDHGLRGFGRIIFRFSPMLLFDGGIESPGTGKEWFRDLHRDGFRLSDQV